MKISEVSKITNVSNDTLRYYERVGLLGPIEKDKSGVRDYTSNDIKRIDFIKCMRNAQLSIEVLKKYFDLYSKGDITFLMKRRELLVREKELLEIKINSMKESYKILTDKIKMYDDRKLDKYLD